VEDLSAIVVLGCRAVLDEAGRLRPGALAGRIDAAARLYELRGVARTVVVTSGGRRWEGGVEADVMQRELVLRGVPERAIVRERCSLSTRDNARFVFEALARRARERETVALVTCDWHMPRASGLFRRVGLVIETVSAPSSPTPLRTRVWRRARETFLRCLAVTLLALVSACSRRASPLPEASSAGSAAPAAGAFDLSVLARAEDLRRARDVPATARRDHDPAVRRRAARALARILDADDKPLLVALDDDDDEVIAWAAYGLGESCRASEEVARAHVRALAARLASLDPSRPRQGRLDVYATLLRALGRCGGDEAEQTLTAWLRRQGSAPEAAAYALADIASRRGSLSVESTAALLEAAERSPPLDAALYPFARSELGSRSGVRARLLAVARAALARAGPARTFAVRALGRSGSVDAAADLETVLASDAFAPAERAEAAHALAALRKAGQSALGDALHVLAPLALDGRALGDPFGVLLATLEALTDPPRNADADLASIARLRPADPAAAPALVRASALRCAAAVRLARGAWDTEALRGCDVGDGEAGERARLAILDAGTMAQARRSAWIALAGSKHVRVREAALEAVERHPELGDAAIGALGDALASPEAGVVATAAQVVAAHPERVLVLAVRERRAALDPRSPPPGPTAAHEPDARIATALRAAIARPWAEDLVETRVALVDASLALGLEEGRAFALAACRDANATVRARAQKALAAAGTRDASCPMPSAVSEPAPEVGHELTRPVRVTFETDAGPLGVRFDPAFAPVAATRFVALARSGFYTGVAFHRVVPGFVVQFGDRGGDGYGGSGRLLRCETSPVPFQALDVGVALAGRDTGSSQIFVTLARQPHLDGEYAWIGGAEGNWDGVVEGDVVRDVHVEE